MFPLDGAPDVADAEKIRFARDAVGPEGARASPRTWVGTAARGAAGDGGDGEPYIQVRRGEDFADSADASFFAKAFRPCSLGLGGPRLADEDAAGERGPSVGNQGAQAERVAEGLMSTRNMKLQAWADVVLRRHGGRFATHPIFAFLVFNMGVRSKNRQASMLGVARKNFARVEGLLKSLTAQRLEAARAELEATVKLRLAAHRGRDPDEAEAFLSDLGTAYKRTRLAISDPMSSAVFFHREMTLFFEHYVNVGEESVFGHVGAYYGRGNAGIGDALAGPDAEEQAAYRERIVRYVDSVFSEELDAEGYCAMQAERSATADISSRLDDVARFTDTFDEEANFCAGATQIHTHSATCVKYSLGVGARKGDLCRFKAPWRLVERTALTADGVLEIRRTHSMVNRWNRAMAVGLRHNHDISFIATQRKTMALIYYITNYTTKGNKTRTFLLKAANRVFTERPLSQVEVIAHLLGYPAEFSSGSAWAYINANQLYWAVFRRWRHLRRASGAEATGDAPDETVVVEEAGLRIPRRGLPAPGRACGASAFMTTHRFKEFSEEDDESCHRRAAVQHLALFLLRRSAEDAKRDAKQWAATAEEGGMTAPQADDEGRGAAEGGEEAYRAGGRATRLGSSTSSERRQRGTSHGAVNRAASDDAAALPVPAVGARVGGRARGDGGGGREGRQAGEPTGLGAVGAALPRQEEVRAIKSQQRSAARERERAIQGIQGGGAAAGVGADRGAALRGGLAGQLTLNEKQAIALLIVCRQLDRIRQGDDAGGDGGGQLCLFIGGEGGTGKSRVIEALVELLARRDLSSRLLVTATSGTAAARINGITLHSACGLTVGQGGRAGGATRDIDGVRLAGQGERFVDGRSRMDWQEKEVLVIDEVSMLGARTLHAANEQLCRLRGSARDFGGIPRGGGVDEDGAFAAEQRRQHDKAHALWRRFTTVVMLDEQMRAAGDPELRRLLGRIRRGEQDRSDLELLNSRCYRPGRRIPWETGLTVVTPLNRNRWNLNLEAALAFRERRRTAARVFLSEHKWRDGVPTEEEAVLMLGQGDDSATPVPAVFLFVPGMPVVVNQNTHQGLKLVNGAGYTAVDVIPDRAFPATASRRSSSCTSAAGGHRAGLGDDQGLPLPQRRQPEGPAVRRGLRLHRL
ncbi:PIF1-like helicase [Hirsutella rhossiliensis]|uniref:ATP-dependent DNA helicase n=1 Tax=Hirsutella rhossiliensis TaxID=111463 RepID=A0A9P8MSG3_9HYPO|nr:PIF1-like helicase domain-containing protein [Hirsutella rhossiliensis]KAH0958377.1 PIF1-like helicase domain-containing protein [Hirsutella rhossiliensis]